jgi:hypothetical protein
MYVGKFIKANYMYKARLTNLTRISGLTPSNPNTICCAIALSKKL